MTNRQGALLALNFGQATLGKAQSLLCGSGSVGQLFKLEKKRRLWENCAGKPGASLQFIYLAFLALLLKRY